MGGSAWVVIIEFCNQLIYDGRAGRLSDGESLAVPGNALRECARQFKVGAAQYLGVKVRGKSGPWANHTRECFEPGMVEAAKGSG
jgi:hypothetical protein